MSPNAVSTGNTAFGDNLSLAIEKGRDDLAREALVEKKAVLNQFDLIENDLVQFSALIDESDSNQKLAAEKLSLTYDQFRGLFRKYRKEL